jgi:hypothetical protein
VGIKSDGTVSYMNPNDWYRAYFRGHFAAAESSVKALQARLSGALGDGEGFGGDESAKSLANYRYMIGMERLESGKSKLAECDSYAEAVKTVRDNLAKGVGKTSKIYEVSMPDKKIAVFGVAMNDEEQADGIWIRKIGMEERIAGLPCEIYVVNGEVLSPHGRSGSRWLSRMPVWGSSCGYLRCPTKFRKSWPPWPESHTRRPDIDPASRCL